jgi:hypothetical protein
VGLKAGIVWTFANNLNVIKLEEQHQSSQYENEYDLEHLKFKIVGYCHQKEDWSVWSCSFVDVANYGNESNNDPEIFLVLCL